MHFADGAPKPALNHFDAPIWVDFHDKVAWGQVRPGATHAVTIQRRRPRGAPPWETLGTVPTGPDGAWQIATPPVAFATYRAIAEDGTTTASLIAVAPGAASGGDDTGTSGDDAAVARRAVGAVPGAPIPRSFAGFSMEYWAAPSYLGGTRPNPILARPGPTWGPAPHPDSPPGSCSPPPRAARPPRRSASAATRPTRRGGTPAA